MDLVTTQLARAGAFSKLERNDVDADSPTDCGAYLIDELAEALMMADCDDGDDFVTFDTDCNVTVHFDRLRFDPADIVAYVSCDDHSFEDAVWHTVELSDGRHVTFGHDNGCGTGCCFRYGVTVSGSATPAAA